MKGSLNATNATLDKKMDSYNRHAQDYVAGQEPTVTITLAEYRELITELATKKTENAALTKECEELKMKLYRMPTYNGLEVNLC